MAITSVGYAGTVDDTEWPQVARFAGGAIYNVVGAGDFAASPGVGDRAVQIAAGTAAGHGVVDVSDGPVTLLLPSVSSGDRWDLIGLQRDWATGVSSVVRVGGSASKVLPSRATNPGVSDVQPLWLVRVRAGQTTAQEFVDLRVWVGEGGAFANDDLVRSYVNRVGVELTIGGTDWRRVIGSTGSAEWAPGLESGSFTAANGCTVLPGSFLRRNGDGSVTGFLMVSRAQPLSHNLHIATLPERFRPPVEVTLRDTTWVPSFASDDSSFVISTSGAITLFSPVANATRAAVRLVFGV